MSEEIPEQIAVTVTGTKRDLDICELTPELVEQLKEVSEVTWEMIPNEDRTRWRLVAHCVFPFKCRPHVVMKF